MLEPGLDRHEWESEWASLEEGLEDSPADVLPQLDDLVGRMLDERGYAVEDPVVREGDDRDVIADFLAAREITRLLAHPQASAHRSARRESGRKSAPNRHRQVAISELSSTVEGGG